MHLFGDTSGPHVAHFHAWHHEDWVELDWELRNSPPLRWRILRSESDFAKNADPPGDNGQTLVSEGQQTHVADRGLGGGHYFYTVFAQDDQGAWHRQAEVRLKAHDAFGWLHPDVQHVYEAQQDMTATLPITYGRSLLYGPPTASPYVRLGEWSEESAD